VAIQADGKIIVVGTSGNDIAVARYKSNGTLDTSFGSGGTTTINFGGVDQGFAVQIQADGQNPRRWR